MGGGSSSGTAMIARSLVEQRKLTGLLKRMRPKTL
jgi:hypothetical protein